MGKFKKTTLLVGWLKNYSICTIASFLLSLYIFVNFLFGLAYYVAMSVQTDTPLLFWDSVYFSFVTAATIGYGDIYPILATQKIIVVVQSVFCAVYIALSLSVITSKLLLPPQDSIAFSEKIIYDKENKMLGFRVINTSSLPIVNPDVRISVTQHVLGDTIAQTAILSNKMASPQFLDNYDHTLWFGKENMLFYEEGCDQETEEEYIINELLYALEYIKKEDKRDSRFRITITVSGSNGVQDFAEIKEYGALDFVKGTGFTSIPYGYDGEKSPQMYHKTIPDFWKLFHSVENEEEIHELEKPDEEDMLVLTV